MRAVIFVVLLTFAGAAAGSAAPSYDARVFELYARTLQHFNPQLDGDTSLDLAAATIDRADREGLDARLLVAVIAVESSWDPAARSRAGARGLGQLMPQTAAGLGVDPDDPYENIAGAAHQLRRLIDRFAGGAAQRYALALAAYNAGSGAVLRYGGIPPYAETRAYVRRVLNLWRRLAGA